MGPVVSLSLVLGLLGCTGTITDRVAPATAPDGGDLVEPAGDAGPAARADAAPPSLPLPSIVFEIEGGLFDETAVRAPVEAGVRHLLDRLIAQVPDAAGGAMPTVTIRYHPADQPYCSGIAYLDSTDLYCPYGYPVTGDNQNFVVNITIHEVGHIAAQALIASPEVRDTCTNEGLATWLAGRYWMNADSAPVGSLRAAARAAIATGTVYPTMAECVLASDRWYKVYGSFFEFLEGQPGAIAAVGRGQRAASDDVEAWAAWLE